MPTTEEAEHLTGWQYLVLKEHEKQQREWDAEGRPPLKEQYVTVPGHIIPVENLTRQSTVGKLAWAAVEHGWKIRIGESEYVTAERWIKGAVVPGKPQVFRWVQGAIIKDGVKHHFSASNLMLMLDGEIVDNKEEVLVHISELGTEGASAADSGD